MKDGSELTHVMRKSDIDAIRDASPTKGEFGPWKTHYEAMGSKTVLNQLAKHLPASAEVAESIRRDEYAQGGFALSGGDAEQTIAALPAPNLPLPTVEPEPPTDPEPTPAPVETVIESTGEIVVEPTPAPSKDDLFGPDHTPKDESLDALRKELIAISLEKGLPEQAVRDRTEKMNRLDLEKAIERMRPMPVVAAADTPGLHVEPGVDHLCPKCKSLPCICEAIAQKRAEGEREFDERTAPPSCPVHGVTWDPKNSLGIYQHPQEDTAQLCSPENVLLNTIREKVSWRSSTLR